MKADQTIQAEVTQSFKAMFESYKKKDLQGVLNCWATDLDVVVIGSGPDEKSMGIGKFVESLMRDWAQAEITGIGVKDFNVSAAGTVAWFSSDLTFSIKVGSKAQEMLGRLTGVMEKRNGKYLWIQMHYSVPNIDQKPGQSWGKRK